MSVSKGKKAISLCLVAVLLMAIAVTAVFAFSMDKVSAETLMSKSAFAYKISNEHKVMKLSPSTETAKLRQSMLQNLVENNASKTSYENANFFVYEGTLKSYRNESGIDWKTERKTNASSNSPNDVTIEAPAIVYDNLYDTWILFASGKWKNGNWCTQDIGVEMNAATNNKTKMIGGEDLFGFKFTEVDPDSDTSGISLYYSKVDFNEVKNDNTGGIYHKYSDSRIDANVLGGVILSAGDLLGATYSWFNYYDLAYLARNFNIIATYSSEFENYIGNASTFTTHTYNSTSLQSTRFGTSIDPFNKSISFTLDLTFNNNNYQWTAYSGGQTRFR